MNKKLDPKLIKALCKPEMLIMGPVTAKSININMPIHTSTRRLYSYPDSLEIIATEVGKIVKKMKVNRIIGGVTAGIPFATVVSYATKIPMCYVRDEKISPPRYPVEGIISPGDKAVLLDDSLVSGNHKKIFIEKSEKAELKSTISLFLLTLRLKVLAESKQ